MLITYNENVYLSMILENKNCRNVYEICYKFVFGNKSFFLQIILFTITIR